VHADASLDEIKAAYRKQAKILHPDKPTGDVTKMRQLTEAYETLLKGNMNAHFAFWKQEARSWQYQHRRAADKAEQEKNDSWFYHAQKRANEQAKNRQKGQYQRQHFNQNTNQSDEEFQYEYFGWGGRDRRWWEETTSEERHKKMREREIGGKKINLKDPFGLKQSRIILGTGLADGSLRW
jgi:DnaJ-class molecular chaperone